MAIQARQRLLGVCAIVMAMGFANAVQGETAPPVVVGLAKCSDCTRKNMNADAVFRGLQVAVKCKNSEGEYESTAVEQVGKSGAFSVPLAADLVGEDGELNRECFAQLHNSASSAPCPGQEPSKIVAAASGHGGNDKTFVALGGKVHRSAPECASAFLCYPFLQSHHHAGIPTPVVAPHMPDHDHSLPPVTKPPVDVPEHKPPVPLPEHKPPSTPVYTPPSTPEYASPSTPVYTPPSTPTPIYHPPAQRNAVTDP
ncbi:hypothetical protein BAE44_0020701 [Dichanthelium oligosanthes]|uniref:Proline-rich protein n=1 Tax=Dichanthelium oligosanthes TaxID=888268 RepID=A0A1E5UZG4_9POAL|nr:hypothetical protein BAE44_0020701 [Dichanthelium oligosanthes]